MNHRWQVEHFEDAFEGDERGHQADLDIGNPHQRNAEATEVRDEGHDRADVKPVLDGEHPTPTVSEGGREDNHEHERSNEEAAVDSALDANIGDARRFCF